MKKFGLNRNTLKYIAAAFMTLDSMYFRNVLPYSVFHLITRFVAPLFAWFMVDGFFHTRNRSAYCKRLWIAAILMQIGDIISYYLLNSKNLGIHDNIFLTLAIGISIIYLFEIAKNKPTVTAVLLRIAAVVIALLGMVFTFIAIPTLFGNSIQVEGGLFSILIIIVAYIFHNSKTKQAIIYAVLGLLIGVLLFDFPMFLFTGEGAFDMLCVNSDWMAFIFLIPFMFLYNGQEGKKSKFGKYFFYVFYPAHLWLISVICYMVR